MSAASEQSGEQLPQGEDSFQRLADGAPVMIWMSGLDMGCFYFNRAWLDFRGRTLEQEAGNGWAEGVHPEDLERCVNHYLLCFERRVPFAMTYRLLNREGEYRWILDRGAPHFLQDNTFLGFFGGCAEIEQQMPSMRMNQLRTSLADVREFARQIAERDLTRTHDLQLEAARSQLERLATDMLTYGHLQPGIRVP